MPYRCSSSSLEAAGRALYGISATPRSSLERFAVVGKDDGAAVAAPVPVGADAGAPAGALSGAPGVVPVSAEADVVPELTDVVVVVVTAPLVEMDVVATTDMPGMSN